MDKYLRLWTNQTDKAQVEWEGRGNISGHGSFHILNCPTSVQRGETEYNDQGNPFLK
jgi:hypothetical protein